MEPGFTVNVAVATTSVGVFVSALTVLLTVDNLASKVFASFVAALLVSGGGIVFGAIRAWLAWKWSSRHLRERYGIGK